MVRKILRDDPWERIESLLPGKVTDVGVTAKDNRLFVEAVLWIGRTGAPWRDLPPELGHWHTTFTRFARWTQKGVWDRVFRVLSQDTDLEEVMLDRTAVRAHAHAAGAQKNIAHRLWVVLAAGSARKSTRSSMRLATPSISPLPGPSKPISRKPTPSSPAHPTPKR